MIIAAVAILIPVLLLVWLVLTIDKGVLQLRRIEGPLCHGSPALNAPRCLPEVATGDGRDSRLVHEDPGKAEPDEQDGDNEEEETSNGEDVPRTPGPLSQVSSPRIRRRSRRTHRRTRLTTAPPTALNSSCTRALSTRRV
jgi:hypothetical protein